MPHKPVPVNATGILLTDVTSDNSAPSSLTAGFAVSGDTHLLVHCGSSNAWGSYHASVYFLDTVSGEWALDTSYGTAGDITVSAPVNLQFAMNRFFKRVYVRVFNFSASKKASVWALQSDVTS